MSVIVEGMKMPVMCSYCKFREPFIDSAYCHLAEMDMEYEESDNCRHPNCPLVEIPTPHGRLGDLDKLWDMMSKYSDNEGAKNPYADNDFMIHRDSACELIEDAPTVIEAEGSEE